MRWIACLTGRPHPESSVQAAPESFPGSGPRLRHPGCRPLSWRSVRTILAFRSAVKRGRGPVQSWTERARGTGFRAALAGEEPTKAQFHRGNSLDITDTDIK